MTRDPIGSASKMGVQNGVTIIGIFGQYPLIQLNRLLCWVDFPSSPIVLFK